MRKIVSLSMGVALAATMFAAFPAAADSAIVSRGGDCFIPGFGSGGELMDPLDEDLNRIYGTVKKLVQNDNHVIVTCKGDIPNDYGMTHQISGWGCAVALPSGEYATTFDSFVKITEDGNAFMRCQAPVVPVVVG